jgi:fatty-acid desaturase
MREDSEKYMNGVGIMNATGELTYALFLANFIFIACLYISVFSYAGVTLPYDTFNAYASFMLEKQMKWRFVIVAVTCGATCLLSYGVWRYAKAIRDLRRHTKAINAETAKRGKGWANS